MRCHTGDMSFGSVLFANVIFAWHDPAVDMDNVIDPRFRKRS